MNVTIFDQEISIAHVAASCMTYGYVHSIDPDENTVEVWLPVHSELVVAVILFNCQSWLHLNQVSHHDLDDSDEFGYNVLPIGDRVNIFHFKRELIEEYYCLGPQNVNQGPAPFRVPICWPILPLADFFVIGYEEGEKKGFPYIDATDIAKDPLTFITGQSFSDEESELKSFGTTHTQGYYLSGMIVRPITGDYVQYFPYEFMSEARQPTQYYIPCPVLQEVSTKFFERTLGIFVETSGLNKHTLGLAFDRWPYAYLGVYVWPTRIKFKAWYDTTGTVLTSFMSYIDAALGYSGVDGMAVFRMEIYFIEGHAISPMYSQLAGVINYAQTAYDNDTAYNTIKYYDDQDNAIFMQFSIVNNSFTPLLNGDTYTLKTYFRSNGAMSEAWIVPFLDDDQTDLLAETDVDYSTDGFPVVDDPVITIEQDVFHPHLDAIALEIPYLYGAAPRTADVSYREDFDNTHEIVVFQNDDFGNVTCKPDGYMEFIGETGNPTTNNYTYQEDWDVDQTLTYKWDGNELCQEIRKGTSSASGTFTSTNDTQTILTGSGTMESLVTVKEIIWLLIAPELGVFIFWECLIMNNEAGYGEAGEIDTDYRLYIWNNGTKTEIEDETHNVSEYYKDEILHPYEYKLRPSNPLLHHLHIIDVDGTPTQVGAGIPRWQVKYFGSYPLIYYGNRLQIPQTVLDEWLTCPLNVYWAGDYLTSPARSLFSFVARYSQLPDVYGPRIHFPWDIDHEEFTFCANAGFSRAYANDFDSLWYKDLGNNLHLYAPQVPCCSLKGYKDGLTLRWGLSEHRIQAGPLNGETFCSHGVDESYTGVAGEIQKIKDSFGSATIDNLKFWVDSYIST